MHVNSWRQGWLVRLERDQQNDAIVCQRRKDDKWEISVLEFQK